MNPHDQSLGEVPLLPFYKRRNHGSEASECPDAIQLVAGARTRTRVCLIRSHVLPPVEKGTGWREGQRHGEEATAGGHGARGVALEVPPDPAALTGRGGGGEQLPPPAWYHRDPPGVDLRRVHAKPGPTLGTIAINRIYFVQLLPTHTHTATGASKAGVGAGRPAFGMAPKKCGQTHTRMCTHGGCAWPPPLWGWGAGQRRGLCL